MIHFSLLELQCFPCDYHTSEYQKYDVLVRVGTLIKPLPEAWGVKSLFGLHFLIIVHHQRKSRQGLKQGRDMGGGADGEDMERASSSLAPLACSPLLAQTAFS